MTQRSKLTGSHQWTLSSGETKTICSLAADAGKQQRCCLDGHSCHPFIGLLSDGVGNPHLLTQYLRLARAMEWPGPGLEICLARAVAIAVSPGQGSVREGCCISRGRSRGVEQ